MFVLLDDGMAGLCAIGVHEVGEEASISVLLGWSVWCCCRQSCIVVGCFSVMGPSNDN